MTAITAQEHEVEQVVARTAAALSADVVAVARDITDAIEREIPEIESDQTVASMLDASVMANVSLFLQVLENGIDCSEVVAPTSAVGYARLLAQRNVPVTALVRAYRIGQARYLSLILRELLHQEGGGRLDGAATIRIIETNTACIDRVVGQVTESYEQERTTWLQHRSTVLMARARSIIHSDLDDIDEAERALAYRLRRRHLGLVLWTNGTPMDSDLLGGMSRLATELADVLGAEDAPLFIPVDESAAWVWIPVGPKGSHLDTELAAGVVARVAPHACVAIGSIADGVEGFRQTHRQAISAQTVAAAAGDRAERVTPFSSIAPIALMCGDIAALGTWVSEILGPLAVSTPRNEGLRETLRVFLSTGGSFAAAAEELHLHRNTVRYRARQAEELRGRPLNDGRLEVELALLACRWLGDSVLEKPNS